MKIHGRIRQRDAFRVDIDGAFEWMDQCHASGILQHHRIEYATLNLPAWVTMFNPDEDDKNAGMKPFSIFSPRCGDWSSYGRLSRTCGRSSGRGNKCDHCR